MTKSELIKRLALKHQNLYLKDINTLVETVIEEIGGALAEGNRVELRGFGSFSTRKRKARMARNPKTNEPVYLNERHSIYFRAGKELKERVNRDNFENSSFDDEVYSGDY